MSDVGANRTGGSAGGPVVLRPATREDSAAIAELFLISSDGLAAYIWSGIKAPGQSLIEIGAERYAREDVAFSYQNCLIVEVGGTIAGMVHCFEMPESDDEETDPVLRPYAELEDPGSLYISGIAVHPEHRNAGLGTRLLKAAHDRARALGLPRVSLICFERNDGAMRLYKRHGYAEVDRRALVPHPTLHYEDGDAVLLVRQA